MDKARQIFFAYCGGFILNLFLSIVLVLVIGITGAAIASLINIIIGVVIARHFLQTLIQLFIDREQFVDIISATAIMTVCIILINTVYTNCSVNQTAAIVHIGAIIYFIVLFILNKQIKDDALRTLGIKWIY